MKILLYNLNLYEYTKINFLFFIFVCKYVNHNYFGISYIILKLYDIPTNINKIKIFNKIIIKNTYRKMLFDSLN